MRPWLGEIVVFVTFVCFAVENRNAADLLTGIRQILRNSWQKQEQEPISLLHLS